MKLTKEHKNILLELGYEEKDFNQIEKATTKTEYRLRIGGSLYHEKLTTQQTIKLLGITDFLSGLARSAFHFGAVRQVGKQELYVFFDSARLFD